MASINEVISTLRFQLSQIGYDDDSILHSDQALYTLLKDAGAIIHKRISDKFNKIPEWMYTSYPVPLTEVNEDMFPCEIIPDRCLVLESVFDIPSALTTRNRSTLRVFFGNKEMVQYNSGLKYDPILKDWPSYKIHNGKLRIYKPYHIGKIKGVTVSAIWYDNMDWFDKKYCEDNSEQPVIQCYNLDEMEMPLFSNFEYASMAYDLVKQQLNFTIQQENQNKPH